ncbi:unnamed protein product [Urochloa humidicola]
MENPAPATNAPSSPPSGREQGRGADPVGEVVSAADLLSVAGLGSARW